MVGTYRQSISIAWQVEDCGTYLASGVHFWCIPIWFVQQIDLVSLELSANLGEGNFSLDGFKLS